MHASSRIGVLPDGHPPASRHTPPREAKTRREAGARWSCEAPAANAARDRDAERCPGRPWPVGWGRAVAVWTLLLPTALGYAAESLLAPPAPATVSFERGAPSRPWAYVGLPAQKVPATRFGFETVAGASVLRIETEGSYGNLVHRLDTGGEGILSWRWRVVRPLERADLRTRQGDDVALKVCALFDMPIDRVPFLERQLLRVAELRTGDSLPTATVCYAWDPSWPSGSVVPNAYSRRVRYITLGGADAEWQSVRRDLAEDFVRAFGNESTSVPRLRAVAVGADADNTGGRSLAFLSELRLVVTSSR